ncbi:unnamed protein product, partial [Symbiodinium sp. CCMP2456]
VQPDTFPPKFSLYVALTFTCATLPIAVSPHLTIGTWSVNGRVWKSWLDRLLNEYSFFPEYYDVQLSAYGTTNFRVFQRRLRERICSLQERLDNSSRLVPMARCDTIHVTWNTLVWDDDDAAVPDAHSEAPGHTLPDVTGPEPQPSHNTSVCDALV